MDIAKKLNTISFFAGYGGVERGLELAGERINHIAICEIEAYAIANLIAKMEEGRLDSCPIWTDAKTFPGDKFLGKVDLFTGGFPCQPFSSAGSRNADEDPRHLFPAVLRAIESFRPNRVLLENVQGLISAKLGGDNWSDQKGTPVLLHVLRELERRGYKTAWGIFSAEEVGAPHQRKRVFILGELADSNSNDARRDSRELHEEEVEERIQQWNNNSESSSSCEDGGEKKLANSMCERSSRPLRNPQDHSEGWESETGHPTEASISERGRKKLADSNINDVPGSTGESSSGERKRVLNSEEWDRNNLRSETERCSGVCGTEELADSDNDGLFWGRHGTSRSDEARLHPQKQWSTDTEITKQQCNSRGNDHKSSTPLHFPGDGEAKIPTNSRGMGGTSTQNDNESRTISEVRHTTNNHGTLVSDINKGVQSPLYRGLGEDKGLCLTAQGNSRKDGGTRIHRMDTTATEELAYCDNEGLEGALSSREAHSIQWSEQNESIARHGHIWPTRPGQPQGRMEEPRVKPKLGRAANGTSHRVDRLRQLGNGVVPQTAAVAWIELNRKLRDE